MQWEVILVLATFWAGIAALLFGSVWIVRLVWFAEAHSPPRAMRPVRALSDLRRVMFLRAVDTSLSEPLSPVRHKSRDRDALLLRRVQPLRCMYRCHPEIGFPY